MSQTEGALSMKEGTFLKTERILFRNESEVDFNELNKPHISQWCQ